jgi:DNA repair protein RecO (recombination protein O)
MKLHTYGSEGIVLGRRNFGEADRIILLYSKDQGKISLIAKGVRRPKSRKRGHVEVFNHVKFQAVVGHGLDIVTEVEIIDDYEDVRSSLKKVSLAYYFVEVVSKITHEGESNPDLYYLLLDTLDKLETVNGLKKLRIEFITKLLIMLGYWPEGREITNPDQILSEVIERQISSFRVGKIISQ